MRGRTPTGRRTGRSCRRLRGSLAAGAILFLAALPERAQAQVIHCVSPKAPMTALPDAVLAEYRTEIAAEFQAYFAAISEFIACLDRERARAMDEARAATDAYATLLTTLPPAKDLP